MDKGVIFNQRWVQIVKGVSKLFALILIAINLALLVVILVHGFEFILLKETRELILSLSFILLSLSFFVTSLQQAPAVLKKIASAFVFMVMILSAVRFIKLLIDLTTSSNDFSFNGSLLYYPNLLSAYTSFGLLLIILGFFAAYLFSFTRTAQVIVFSANVLASIFILNFFFHPFTHPSSLVTLGLTNAFSLYLLSFQLLTQNPTEGYPAFFVREDFAGKMLRKQLPITVLGYVIFGLLCLLAQHFLNTPPKFFITVMITVAIVVFTLIAFVVARPLAELDVQRRFHEEQLAYSALHDKLTNLPNRMLLLDRLQQAIFDAERKKTNIAVIFLDLDHFKLVNDNLGHSAGDQLLKSVSKRIEDSKRQSDTFSRLGGDEFVLLIPELQTESQSKMLIQRIQDQFEEPFFVGDQLLPVGCSMGVSFFPRNGNSAEELLKNADIAMYSAKAKGRNTFEYYTQEMNLEVKERLLLQQDLFRALHRKEFYLDYQPIVDSKTQKIRSVEVLFRWKNTKWAHLPIPHIFGAARDAGLLSLLNEWVLKKACEQNLLWREEGLLFLPISVNLPGYLLDYKNALESIGKIIDEVSYPGEYLEIELTENVIMSSQKEAEDILSALKKKGVSFSIDDFGIGLLNFNHLVHLPIDKLKIDRSIIREIPQNPKSEVVVQATIAMAHEMSMQVIAEGVETEEQLQFLVDHSCDAIQGYYFSRPLSAEDYAKLLVTAEQA